MRYLPLTEPDRRVMLDAIGVPSIDDLFAGVPERARQTGLLDLPRAAGELEVERALTKIAAANLDAGHAASFLGCGVYRHHVPASVDHLIQRGEFLTSYTPYQPEIAQGTLQTLFEFQTQVALLTGMEVANASLYDGATACAEAVMMALRVTRRQKAILASDLHPHYRETCETHAKLLGFTLEARRTAPETVEDLAPLIDGETACVVVQTPGFFGRVHDHRALAEACHQKGALLVVVVSEVMSLGLIEPPGAMGADIVAGEGQSLGNAMNFGGPHLGLFATRERYLRQMPGRIAGETKDVEGRRGFVLTLSTREQHIRREKATSNICTNSGLAALAFTIHLALLGEAGFTRLAEINHAQAVTLAAGLTAIPGVALATPAFFNEFTLRLPKEAAPVIETLAQRGILAGVPASRFRSDLPYHVMVAATETNTPEEMTQFATHLAEVLR